MHHLVRDGEYDTLSVPDLERDCGVRVIFTGRKGGLGTGHLESLNLSYHVGEDPTVTSANRDLVAARYELPLERWVLAQQVHGAAIKEAGPLDAARGARDHWSALPRTDAMLTLDRRTVLGVLTADCVPLVLVEPLTPAVAVVHAGWRGVLSGVALKAALRLASRTRRPVGDILAFAGPHIGPCCFEVGAEVARLFEDSIAGSCVARTGQTYTIDLHAALRSQLVDGGLDPRNISDSSSCTACSPGYFSFRRDNGCGRQAALVSILARESDG